MRRALMISSKDNVATALEDVSQKDVVEARLGKEVVTLEAREVVPFGFKIALRDIVKGEDVVKYGESIGRASRDIARGSLVHVHNLEGARGRGDLVKKRLG